MFLVPYKRVEIQSPLPLDEARRRIATAVDTRRWWSSLRSDKYFHGRISDDEFRLIPVIEGRNTYLPVIHADLRPTSSGSEVRFTFALHPLAAGIMILFLVMPFWMEFNEHGRFSPTVLIFPAIVIGIHILLYFTGFLPEVRRAESFLRDLLGDYR